MGFRCTQGFGLCALAEVCAKRPGQGWTCGRRLHAQAESALGRKPHVMPRLLVKRLAGKIAQWALAPTSRQRLSLISQGQVKRHRDRGESPESRRARRREEDDRSTAGARNPAALVKNQPRLLEAAARIRAALLRAFRICPNLTAISSG